MLDEMIEEMPERHMQAEDNRGVCIGSPVRDAKGLYVTLQNRE
jgi:hypothetical protein